MNTRLTKEARAELVRAVRSRYGEAPMQEKRRMLAELIAVTGYHPKSALRLLHQAGATTKTTSARKRAPLYDEAARQALVVLWEASDRVCGKRLKPLLRTLLPAMERHGHVWLESEVREKLMQMSAATIDRLLRDRRIRTKKQRPRRTVSEVRQKIPVRTFGDWHSPNPGAMEIDLVSHSGGVSKGSFVHTLVLTDIATGWTECAPLVVRDGKLIVETLERVRLALPFALRAIDTDNGTEFVNESLVSYCADHGIELTRSRPWLKNDQAWIEQKNGAIVRKALGEHRFEGIGATQCLARLYTALRFFVNFFQTSFKLAEKNRDGSLIRRRYLAPATPCERLLDHPAIPTATKVRLREVADMLDPIRLLEEVRAAQQQLETLAHGGSVLPPRTAEPDLMRFLANLSTARCDVTVQPARVAISLNEAAAVSQRVSKKESGQTDPGAMAKRPENRAKTSTPESSFSLPPEVVRRYPRRQVLDLVWPQVVRWLDACPNLSSAMIFDQLLALYPGRFQPGQVGALERRVKAWREVARMRGVVIGKRKNRQSPGYVRVRRRKDPFEHDWVEICQWLETDPDCTATELLAKLQTQYPARHPNGELRTLQRRVKAWRAEAVRKLIFDVSPQPSIIGNGVASQSSVVEPPPT